MDILILIQPPSLPFLPLDLKFLSLKIVQGDCAIPQRSFLIRWFPPRSSKFMLYHSFSIYISAGVSSKYHVRGHTARRVGTKVAYSWRKAGYCQSALARSCSTAKDRDLPGNITTTPTLSGFERSFRSVHCRPYLTFKYLSSASTPHQSRSPKGR